MPYQSEHAARLKNPEMPHIRVRRTSGSGNGTVQGVKIPNSIDIIWYIIKTAEGEASVAQTLRFPSNKWTSIQAKEWLDNNKIKYMLFEKSSNEKAELSYEHVVDINKDEATIFLYGGIGEELDGNAIAKEIYQLNQDGVKVIHERINSDGGSVGNGLSIVAANLNSEAEIRTYNDGRAASMAAIILLTGDRIYMADYAQLMYHEPSLMGETINSTNDEKIKRCLISNRDSISNIMQSRTKKNKAECDSILEAETWYNANEAKDNNLIDEIIDNPRKINIRNEMSYDDIISAVAATYNNNSNKNTMENLLKALDVSTEVEAIDKINDYKKVSNTISEKDKEIVTLKSENSKLLEDKTDVSNQLTELTNSKNEVEDIVKEKDTEISDLTDKLLDSVIDQAVMIGTFTEKDREALKAQFKDNVDGLKFVIKNSSLKAPNILNMLNPKDQLSDVQANWGHIEWSKNDPGELNKIRNSDPKRYNELGKKSYGKAWIEV